MGKKNKKGELTEKEEELLTTLIEKNRMEFELNTNRQVFYLIVALVTTLLPSYLFQSVKGFEFRGFNIVLYFAICLGSAQFLTVAYHNIFTRMRIKLKSRYDDILQSAKGNAKTDQKELESQKDHFTELGATGYALAFVNALYLFAVLFVGFYLLKKSDLRMNFIASVLFSAIAVNWFSTKKSDRAQ